MLSVIIHNGNSNNTCSRSSAGDNILYKHFHMNLVHIDCDNNECSLPKEMAYQRYSQYSILLKVDASQDEQLGNCESD